MNELRAKVLKNDVLKNDVLKNDVLKTRSSLILIVLLLSLLTFVGCKPADSKTMVVAEQYGLAYAPLQIMKEKHFLEETLGSAYKVDWLKLSNTAAIREAMLSSHLDIGFMAIPPFLIGIDQKMPWKIMTGLSSSQLGLVTNDPTIFTLKDLVGRGKIALPQPGSIQHILLSMAAEKELGQGNVFDSQLIAMNHPDGYQALLGKSDVVAHFTAPPYLYQELDDASFHLVVSSDEIMEGGFTFIVGVCQESLKSDVKRYDSFMLALNHSIAFMQTNREETIAILSASYELEPSVVDDYVYQRDMYYGTEIKGISAFIDFMTNENYLTNPIKEEDVIWKK